MVNLGSKEYNLTILISAHTSEANSGKISQAMNRGASALVDGCRWQAGLIRLDKETAEYYGIENPREYVVMDTPKNNYAADIAKPIYFRRTDTGALVHCNLREDADKAKADYICELLKADPEQHTKRDIRNSKDFLADIKDRFKKFKREEIYPLLDKLIEQGRLEEIVSGEGRKQRIVLSVI